MTAVTLRPVARHAGRDIHEATLSSAGAEVSLLSWGGALRDWRTPDGTPMTLGFDTFAPYPEHSRAFGALCGRVANRIEGARFTVAGREARLTPNEGPNLLHGGAFGFGIRPWDMEIDAAAGSVRLSLQSPEGEGGWPGALDTEVIVTLTGARLSMQITATPDRETPVNIAQHSYWNLDGGGDVLGHRLRIDADAWTPTDAAMIPTGEIRPVAGGPMDFRGLRGLIGADGAPLRLDHNMALRAGRDMDAPAAEVIGASGRTLRLWTDRPGVQVYDAPGLDVAVPGLDGRRYGAYAGLCLEPQGFPDAVNQPGFPSILHGPDRPYRQSWAVEIA
jgi:aldose 1-epimerase